MEKITAYTFLYYATLTAGAGGTVTAGTPTKLTDITSYPAPYTPPERIEITDLSSNQRKYTKGLIDHDDMSFGFVYDHDVFESMLSLAESNAAYRFYLCFGEPTPSSGTLSDSTITAPYGLFRFDGTMAVTVDGGDIGAARTGTITLYPETEIEFDPN